VNARRANCSISLESAFVEGPRPKRRLSVAIRRSSGAPGLSRLNQRFFPHCALSTQRASIIRFSADVFVIAFATRTYILELVNRKCGVLLSAQG
jgi:hypothetical protein